MNFDRIRLGLAGGIAAASLVGIVVNRLGVADADPYRLGGVIVGAVLTALLLKRLHIA